MNFLVYVKEGETMEFNKSIPSFIRTILGNIHKNLSNIIKPASIRSKLEGCISIHCSHNNNNSTASRFDCIWNWNLYSNGDEQDHT